MAAQIPYAHDDWDHGLAIGMQRFLSATLNSRYVGNLFVIVMTRSSLLKTLIMGATCFLLPYTISAIVGKRMALGPRTRLTVFLLTDLLLLTMERFIFMQTYGWVSGFANFVISSLFLAVYCYIALDIQRWKIPLSFLLSIATGLFIENLTLYVLLLSTYLCVTHWRRCRKLESQYLLMVLGALIGTAIMFSSSVYRTLAQTGTAVDGYRLFFTSNTFLILFAGHLLAHALNGRPDRTLRRASATCLALCLTVCVYLTVVFFQIGQCARQRIQIIEQAKQDGTTQIVLPAYPHREYLWDPDPTNDQRWIYFKEFYGIDPEIEVVIQP
ncbi:MAG: hypothetical protein IJW45_05645 [Oscillospiraceae bacterium]|nr:hypothetical protein [Oscillospiraceae bacterium]